MTAPDDIPAYDDNLLPEPEGTVRAQTGSIPVASVAHMVARIVAAQAVPASEIPALVATITNAFAGILYPAARAPAASSERALPAPRERRPPRVFGRKPGRPRKIETPPAVEVPPQPPAPRLVRRAEAVPAAPPAEPAVLEAPPSAGVRGVVRWFDPNRRTGELRLAGISGDLTVEPAVFAAAGITRLFKGQEIEAEVAREMGRVRVTALRVLGQAAAAPSTTGPIAALGGKRPRVVIVEKRRDALKRIGARSAAEHVLGSTNGSGRSS